MAVSFPTLFFFSFLQYLFNVAIILGCGSLNRDAAKKIIFSRV